MNGRYGIYASGGGWVAPLSDKARQNIAKLSGQISLEAMEAAYGWYQLERQVLSRQPPPNEAKKELRLAKAQLDKLLPILERIGLSPIASLLRNASFPAGDPEALKQAINGLRQLSHIIPRAIDRLPAGQKRDARAGLVARLIPIVRGAGLNVDAAPKGPLCSLVSIIFEDRDEQCADIRSVVRPIVRQWETCSKTEG